MSAVSALPGRRARGSGGGGRIVPHIQPYQGVQCTRTNEENIGNCWEYTHSKGAHHIAQNGCNFVK